METLRKHEPTTERIDFSNQPIIPCAHTETKWHQALKWLVDETWVNQPKVNQQQFRELLFCSKSIYLAKPTLIDDFNSSLLISLSFGLFAKLHNYATTLPWALRSCGGHFDTGLILYTLCGGLIDHKNHLSNWSKAMPMMRGPIIVCTSWLFPAVLNKWKPGTACKKQQDMSNSLTHGVLWYWAPAEVLKLWGTPLCEGRAHESA